ncbi:MAG: hypothetical protein P8045_14755, partial [Candidatus Thiodiazotropha sp.]
AGDHLMAAGGKIVEKGLADFGAGFHGILSNGLAGLQTAKDNRIGKEMPVLHELNHRSPVLHAECMGVGFKRRCPGAFKGQNGKSHLPAEDSHCVVKQHQPW